MKSFFVKCNLDQWLENRDKFVKAINIKKYNNKVSILEEKEEEFKYEIKGVMYNNLRNKFALVIRDSEIVEDELPKEFTTFENFSEFFEARLNGELDQSIYQLLSKYEDKYSGSEINRLYKNKKNGKYYLVEMLGLDVTENKDLIAVVYMPVTLDKNFNIEYDDSIFYTRNLWEFENKFTKAFTVVKDGIICC